MNRRVRHILLLIIFLCGGSAFAAPGGPGRGVPKKRYLSQLLMAQDSVSATIPFNRVGNLILVEAQADTIKGNFIFDTGAAHLLLNETYFRDYPVTEQTDVESAGVTGGATPLHRTVLRDLGLGDLHYRNQEAHLGNLGHLENAKGVRILGLLGMSLFQDCEILIDYEHNLLYIHRVRRRESLLYSAAMLEKTPGYFELPIELKEGFVLVSTEVGGRKLQFVMDSGAESSVLDSRLPNAVFQQVQITRRVALNGSSGRKNEAFFGTLSQMDVGGQALTGLPVLISSLEHTCFADMSCINGILSFDAFAPRRMGFNFVTRKLYVWK
jgi:predicted aspartyl protease